MSIPSERKRTTFITLTATLGALVIVFDYSLKFSGLKIPFPFLPMLKFDFSGIPIVLALLLCGLTSGAATCIVAFLGIVARSGDLIGASMKAVAEFSTILGMAPFFTRGRGRVGRILGTAVGVVLRALVMTGANLLILPSVYHYPSAVVAALLLPIAGFNAVQGVISIVGGWILYEAIVWRIPSLADLRGK